MIEKRFFSLYDMNDYRKVYYTNDDFIKRIKLFVSEQKLGELVMPIEIGQLTAEYDSEMYHKIKSSYRIAALKYKIKITEYAYSVICTPNEMNKASFFKLELGIYGNDDYTESYKTEYRDEYCKVCNTHQRFPQKEVYINKREFRGKDISCSSLLYNEILVSDKMKKLLEAANTTGVEFYTAYHWNNSLKNDYSVWHMVVTNILPLLDKSMPVKKIEGYCEVCKCHHILPLSYMRYKRCDLKQALDFNLSKECFGTGWYGSPKLIVSRQIYDIIKKNKIKGCNFEIVEEI